MNHSRQPRPNLTTMLAPRLHNQPRCDDGTISENANYRCDFFLLTSLKLFDIIKHHLAKPAEVRLLSMALTATARSSK
jgi:hypothetical protein